MKKLIVLFALILTSVGWAQEKQITLNEYYKNKLYWVTKVESDRNIFYITGYQNSCNQDTLTTKEIRITKGQVFTINNWGKELTPTLVSIPYKVRLKAGDQLTETQTGLNNVGVNFALYGYTRDRYFINNTMSKHKFNIGIWAGPAVEELNASLTDGYLVGDKKSKQFFISTAATITYSYNNITFSLVPIGYDFATSTIGEHFVYNQKRWWGFGIGLDPKIFSFISTKKP